MMTGLCFFVYISISLKLVFGEYGIANNNNDQHGVAIDNATTTNQEYKNISERPQEKSEKIQKAFSLPKSIIIGATILAVPALGYKIYNRKKQEPTSDKSESTEEKPRAFFWKGLTIDELPILVQQPQGYSMTGYFDGLDTTKDEEMKWLPGVTGTQALYGYPKHPTGSLKVEDLNSSIRVEWPDNIYSPQVYDNLSLLFASARRFGLPPYRNYKGEPEERAVHIEHTFYLWKKDEYLKKFKEIYGPRFNEVKSKTIDNMVDDVFKDKQEISIGKIKTNLPVGFAVEVQTQSWNSRSELVVIVCAHGLDANTGETIVSIAQRRSSDIPHIHKPLKAVSDVPEDILRTAMHTFAHIALNTLPKQKDTIGKTTEIGTSGTSLPVRNDNADESA